MKLKRISAAIGVALLISSTLVVQAADENLASGILAARKKQVDLLKQYNWNSRTEIQQNDNTEDIRIDLVNLGPDGHAQRSILNDEKSDAPRRFIRRVIAEERRKEIERYLRELSDLVDQYTLPSDGKVMDFLSGAEVQPVTTDDGKTVLQITGNGIVVPDDNYVLTVDQTTLEPTQVQITSSYDGNEVTINASFITMKDGLNHVQFATVEVPDKHLTLLVHNYDYVSIE